MVTTRRAAAGLLAAAVLAASCSAAFVVNTPADFLEANADEFQCVWALLERAGLTEAMADGELSNTYFLPTDAAFITDLAQTAPALSVEPEQDYVADLTVDQIVSWIDVMSPEAAQRFLKAHVSPVNYPSVSSLAYPNGTPDVSADPFGGEPVHPTIDNSLGQKLSVVYEASYHALYLDAKPDAKGNGRAVAYIAGPAAMPAGESTMYVLLNVLGDPKLITAGAALVAQAVDAAGADAPAPAPRTST
ncbi:Nex18 symbiotically induced [Micractinium conductrix]|uniref:Nex18 symbiotically induced n=1 Tax=Micractinium conductrix TaxID=554055 RepID=A0A2P6VRU0_9CHLO|nr:Nex18 symbiotically induced [Micractinium conductrix]|eukprot:PSC76818.1 Nex18 symbiotically induced [Micractinium conductrix]